MSKNTLYPLWSGCFIVCAGLGFIPDTEGAARFFLTVLGIAFFVPPALALWKAHKEKDLKTACLIRNLAGISLGLTLTLMILNILSALGAEWLGQMLHVILVIVSAPMFCCGSWALSLFLWACLLIAAWKSAKQAG